MNRRDLAAMAGGLFASGSMGTLWSAVAPQVGASSQNETSQFRFFDVHSFGAAGDGSRLDSAAINSAIDAAAAVGGGFVYVRPGVYLCGTVVLKSNVTLYLEAGATILGSKTISDYSPNPGPHAKGDANQKHLIFARDARNVGLAGPGRIDGQGAAFWVPSNRKVPPPEDGWKDVATYDWKPVDRPSPMLEFVECESLRIEDVRIENAPGWTLRPANCNNVTIRGIRIKNPVIGPNTDGIDLTGCTNVFISDCHIDTGDDAICLKSENPYGDEPRISRNITITNCVLTCCCNGLKFGTSTRGGYENITFSNCVIANDDVPLNARVISGIALEMVDGGWLEGVTISNIRMQRVRTPIFLRRGIRHAAADGTAGVLRGVMMENIHAIGAILTSSVTGLPGFDVEDVTLSNIRIDTHEGGQEEWVSREVPEVPKAYPEARMFGRLPSYGFYCRHVKGLRIRDLVLETKVPDARPTIVCDDVKDLDIDGLRAARITTAQPVIKLIQTRGAWLRGCAAPENTDAFVRVEGEHTDNVLVTNCDLRAAKRAIDEASGVPVQKAIAVANITANQTT
mgnify:CR=1 FL=1